MYLKKLELIGFKSFLNKTVLNFEPGMTAVVGPNGCGKSNVFDSIRWVLGEQSVKSLRGSDMQDVIFNGTDTKEPLNMAEVNMAFDNTNRFFSIDNDEVVITRRIFRSGESEYLLNKNLVRLKDIMDILMGTGIGAESYSLVAQGKIDLILSSRPEERRLVFDEASGITKYKSQKKEALRKLEETEQNLLRVNDIITEVKRQIGSLERQANKARKYKDVFEELKSKEINLAILQKISLLKNKDALIKQLDELQKEESKLLEAIKEHELSLNNRHLELKRFESDIASLKNEILNLENLSVRNKEHISINQERLLELDTNKQYLESQVAQLKHKLGCDEEKLNSLRREYDVNRKNVEDKNTYLKEKNKELNTATYSIKTALDNISRCKKEILDLVSKIASLRNEIMDVSSAQQVFSSRKKRLDLEKAKLNEEKSVVQSNMDAISQDIEGINNAVRELNNKALAVNADMQNETAALDSVTLNTEELEKKLLSLISHKEFIEKLKSKYDDIGEVMNAQVVLDRMPKEKIAGLVVKIREFQENKLMLIGEAKPIDMDSRKINEIILATQSQLDALIKTKESKKAQIEDLRKIKQELERELRAQEIAFANKKTSFDTVQEQFNKIKEEDEVINIELSEVESEASVLDKKLIELKIRLSELEGEDRQKEDLILSEQNKISMETALKEKALVNLTQIKTELDALSRRIASDEKTLSLLEDTYKQDEDNLAGMEKRIDEIFSKKEGLLLEIKDAEDKIKDADELALKQKESLKARETEYNRISEGTSQMGKRIGDARIELDKSKERLYELQMQNKDIDFKFLNIKERMQENYKIDIESLNNMPQQTDEALLSQDIEQLKSKLDSYGTVNLVAIEEYDELKKRYDFLAQQQNDLVSAKDSLQEAIQKINRTTRKMFIETFEKVAHEFKNYFRMLFNGGDAQVFLIDEHDPLESGIEIICRPPGKKLQNVLLLSGGEKAMSAIALIFAIFKVKPSPFCVLDEIDAPLDEANVDRFGKVLQEFTKQSQFIVITHNKKTIANADVMYGITMEESGVSKIVSVKFAQKREPEVEVTAV